MSIEVGSLSYISTLDNSDFQVKSLQDIKLIQTRLELTGDTSGVDKYNQAVKNAADSQIKLQAELNQMLANAKIQVQELAETQNTSSTKISEQSTEVQKLAESYSELESASSTVNNLNLQLDELVVKQEALTEQFRAGTITEDDYARALDAINVEQQSIIRNIELVNDYYSTNILIQQQVTEQIEAQTAAYATQAGILAELNISLIQLKSKRFLSTDITDIEGFNFLIQETEAEIQKFTNIGKYGFDEYGLKIKQTSTNLQESIGLLETLQAQLAELKTSRITIVDPQALSITNQRIQETELAIGRFSNVGKEGFDEFGNKIKEVGTITDSTGSKISYFGRAIDNATNASRLGARVVTQFTRQIITLGVGFLSLEIGAKAIESLIKYIENLDVFTGRLDQAKQNLLAFNEVMADADKSAGTQIATLKVLYETATDTNLALKDRLIAAEQLRDSYAAEFQGANALVIVNDKLRGSYEELTKSILEVARAQAASTKIGQLEGQRNDLDFQIQKNNSIKDSQTQKAIAEYQDNLLHPERNFLAIALQKQVYDPSQGIKTALDLYKAEIAQIKKTTDESNLKPTQQLGIINGTEAFLEPLAEGVNKGSNTLKEANGFLGSQLENFKNLISGAAKFQDKTQLDNISKALQLFIDNPKGVNPTVIDQAKKDLQQVKDLEKSLFTVKASKDDHSVERGDTLLAGQTQVLDKIQALKDKYATKDKTRDEQELDDIRAQFTKTNQEIDQQNTKVQNALKTKKITQPQLDAIGVSVLPHLTDDDLNNALASATGLQNAERLKDQLEIQKGVFKEYEDFKLKVGTETADQVYANETQGFKTYIDYLKSQLPSETQLNSSDPTTKATASRTKDLVNKELVKAQGEQLTQSAKYLNQLLEQNQDYESKLKTLKEVYGDEIIALVLKGYIDEANVVSGKLKAEIELEQAYQAQRLLQARDFSSQIVSLTKEQALIQIQQAKAQADSDFANGKISEDTYKQLIAFIQQANKELGSDEFVNYLNYIGEGLTKIGDVIGKTNGNLGAFISSIGTALTTTKQLYDLSVKMQANGGFLKSLEGSDPSDAISVITTGLTDILSLVNGLITAGEQRKQQAEDYYNSVIAFQNAYNLALIQQEQVQYKTDGNVFFENYAEEFSDAAKAYTDATADFNTSLQALQSGQAIVGQKTVVNGKNVASSALSGAGAGAAIGAVLAGPTLGASVAIGAVVGGVVGAIAGLFGGGSKKSVLAPLLEEYPELITKAANGTTEFNEALAKTLIANNQVSDSTKVLLQNTINYYDEQQAAIDQINSALTSLAGDLGTSIQNALVNAFETGTDAAQAFGNSVSDVISGIIQNFLFEDIFGSQFDALNKSLQATVLAGGTPADITQDFITFFQAAGPLVNEFQSGLAAAQQAGATQGLTLFTQTPGQGTLSGQIQQNITEATGTIIAGTLNGIQLNGYTTNQLLSQNVLSMGQMVGLAQDGINVLLAIQTNTGKSAANSDLEVDALTKIVSNTQSSASTALRAAGKYGY